MKFALLGSDQDSRAVAVWLSRQPDQAVVVAYCVAAEDQAATAALCPGLTFLDDWESLLHDPQADAVLIASWRARGQATDDLRADQLRKLAQTNMPLLLVHPACESIVGFELEMIRRDSPSPLVVIHGDLGHDALRTLARYARDPQNSPIGPVEQLVIERRLARRTADELRWQLARDMAIVRRLVGNVRRVSALGGAFQEGAFHLSAQLDTENQVLVRWAPAAAEADVVVTISLYGPRGVAQGLQLDSGHWKLNVDGQDVPATARTDEAPRLGTIIDNRGCIVVPPELSWMDSCRAQEVAEAVERSAVRGRTVELFNQELSEAENFKGVMAVGSCGLLLLVLAILILGAVLEGLRLPFVRSRVAPREEIASSDAPDASPDVAESENETGSRRALWLRLWPVYPLLTFLVLQLFRVFAAESPSRRGPPGARKSTGPNERPVT